MLPLITLASIVLATSSKILSDSVITINFCSGRTRDSATELFAGLVRFTSLCVCRNQLTEQIEQQQIACKAAVQQLKEWEIMGARLKAQVTDVNKQIESKNKELTEVKVEVLQQRKEIEVSSTTGFQIAMD